MRRAGSLWHKIKGEATPRNSPRHRGGRSLTPTRKINIHLNLTKQSGLSAHLSQSLLHCSGQLTVQWRAVATNLSPTTEPPHFWTPPNTDRFFLKDFFNIDYLIIYMANSEHLSLNSYNLLDVLGIWVLHKRFKILYFQHLVKVENQLKIQNKHEVP